MRYFIVVPQSAPRRAVTVYDRATLAVISALGTTMTDGVNKKQSIAGFHMNLDSTFGDLASMLAVHLEIIGIGMSEVGFV